MKIYSSKRYLPAGLGPVTILYPFWGKPPEDPADPNSGRYDGYMKRGRSFFQMVELPESDVAIYPRSWGDIHDNAEGKAMALQFAEEARRAGKPVAIFFWSDMDENVPIENAIVFRTSLYRSRRRPNEYAMPNWSEDFLKAYLDGRVPVRSKRERAVVGFCGYATALSLPWQRIARRTTGRLLDLLGIRRGKWVGTYPGLSIRNRAIRTLSKSSLVETNFKIRSRFWAGAVRSNGTVNAHKMHKARKEFLQNIVDSDYTLCARGAGNSSYRLYETLSCGRIPVFIDTDSVLPYDFEIDWKKYCVWVDEKEVPHIAERVKEFHDSLSQEEFTNRQQECRRLWEEWLSPDGFFNNFHKHFEKV